MYSAIIPCNPPGFLSKNGAKLPLSPNNWARKMGWMENKGGIGPPNDGLSPVCYAHTFGRGDLQRKSENLDGLSSRGKHAKHCHEVRRRAGQDEDVPDFVIAEFARRKIEKLGGVDHTAERVNHPACDEPGQGHG